MIFFVLAKRSFFDVIGHGSISMTVLLASWMNSDWGGMLYEASDGLEQVLAGKKVTGYIGFAPSAPSLHVGSLLSVMELVHLQRYGHRSIAVVGGGTGRIGDPSRKRKERLLLSQEEIDHNLGKIRTRLSRFLDFDSPANAALIAGNGSRLLFRQ